MNQEKKTSRRIMLFRSGIVLGAIILTRLATDTPAKAGSMSKGMLHYQNSPKDGKMCADCAAYTPPPSPDAGTGTCKIVAGPVNPQGWCMAFSQR
ncbi:high-potential iron-sulfur protein [Collimonas silvisoli]|uniref:high-potential iron-sulfur protein n=1 Tax=Collimonas silvisoli TaxID=2825884 RepID=UPI001B8D4D5B|nr:high-potential iron-sulfur protein [Collimonas silvisoli]